LRSWSGSKPLRVEAHTPTIPRIQYVLQRERVSQADGKYKDDYGHSGTEKGKADGSQEGRSQSETHDSTRLEQAEAEETGARGDQALEGCNSVILSAMKNPEIDGAPYKANILWVLHSAALRSE
jgi:hypothetical protein